MGIFRSSTVASTSPRVSSFMVTSSSYGSVLKLVFGTSMVAPVLIDYDDFTAISHTTTTSSGGKGGSVKSSNTTYTYTVMVLMALGEGILTATGNIWEGSKVSSASALNLTFFNGSIGQSPWGYLLSNHPSKALGYSGTSYLAGVLDLGDSSSLPNFNIEVYGLCQNQQGTPSTVKLVQTSYIKTVEVAYYSSNIGVQEYVYGSGGNYWADLDSRYYSIASKKDAYGNDTSTYVYTFNFDDRKDGYDRDDPLYIRIRYNATVASVSYTATDANLRDVIYTLLTSTVFGANFPAVLVDDMLEYGQYCIDNSLLMSPVLDSQQQASDVITSLAEATNSEYVFSQAKARMIPYYDGLEAVYDITDDNLMEQDDDTISIKRTSQSDVYNVIPVEYLDRRNQYNTAVVYATDEGDIDVHGLRQQGPKSHHEICNASLAQTVAQTILQKQIIKRNQYTVKLPPCFVLLDNMDPVTIASDLAGIDVTAVRVISIKESADDFTLEVVLEDNPSGTTDVVSYPTQEVSRGSLNLEVSPGTINAPIIFDPPSGLTSGGLQTWIIPSGQSANCGGFNIWVSLDNLSYKKIGYITGNRAMGVLSSSLPSGTSPDTVNTLPVNLSESLGTLASGTQTDANNYVTICYVDGELIAYETATLTAVNAYNLSYLVRGIYGTTISAHTAGSKFARLNDAVFKYSFADNMIGQTVYIKMTALNVFGNGEEDLADVPYYTHVLTNNGKGSSPSSYTHYQSVVSTSWVIVHNLNKYPVVSCLDSSNQAIQGAVTYNSVNQLTVKFSQAVAGTAYLT